MKTPATDAISLTQNFQFSWNAWPWRWRHYKIHWIQLIQWLSITFSETWIISNNTVRTSNLTVRIPLKARNKTNLMALIAFHQRKNTLNACVCVCVCVGYTKCLKFLLDANDLIPNHLHCHQILSKPGVCISTFPYVWSVLFNFQYHYSNKPESFIQHESKQSVAMDVLSIAQWQPTKPLPSNHICSRPTTSS
jgi:hypothetical protein